MWFDYFHAQFDALAADLGVVLDASGCREGWLQGELFRRSPDQDFAVNTYPYTDIGGKADLEGLRPCVTGGEAAMVAELKVVGGRFAKKCLDGRNWTNAALLDTYRPGPDGRIMPLLEQVDQASGNSILADIQRLRTVTNRQYRYMILVRPYHGADTALGRILERLKLAEREETWRFPNHGFDVRMWAI
ncbi:hypothetical protein [Azospirillum argentinense]|nr:hypothetical protein [Azospirillum argentinense]